MSLRFKHLASIAMGAGIAALIAACDSPAPAGAGEQGPMEVGVVTVTVADVPLVADLPGRTTAYRKAEVRPQVTGIIDKRLFTEGSEVKQAISCIRSIQPLMKQPMPRLRLKS